MDIEMMEYWEPALMKEPVLPEGMLTMVLMQNEQTGVLDVVMIGQGDGTVLASLYEGPGGWHVVSNGLYITHGPKRTIEGALKAAVRDEKVVRYLVAELTGALDDEPTKKLEVRCG